MRHPIIFTLTKHTLKSCQLVRFHLGNDKNGITVPRSFQQAWTEHQQPIRKAVSYRGLFTAGWFDVREKHCSRLEIYDHLRTREQAATYLVCAEETGTLGMMEGSSRKQFHRLLQHTHHIAPEAYSTQVEVR